MLITHVKNGLRGPMLTYVKNSPHVTNGTLTPQTATYFRVAICLPYCLTRAVYSKTFLTIFRVSQKIWNNKISYCQIPNFSTCYMMLFGRTIRICHKYIFKILTIKFIGMSYCFRNFEYDKKYGILGNVILYMARVKQYGKHMITLK